jgi:hypothetical protein
MEKPGLPDPANLNGTGASDPGSLTSGLSVSRFPDGCQIPSAEKLEEYRQRIVDTNIDARSFLSTDYLNAFNSIVMLLDMLPDAPELVEEVENWRFLDYAQHFKASGLSFADLAIEVYPFAPPDLREALERKANGIRIIIEELARMLRRLLDAGEKEAFSNIACTMAAQMRVMMEEGNGIIHGGNATAQADIDKLF